MAATEPPSATEATSSEMTGSRMIDVVFQLPAGDDAHDVVLVGDFNGWSQAAHHMTRVGNVFEITVPLEKDRRYVYRYLIDGRHWENDWNADEYVRNEFGGDDSVRYT